MTEGFISGGLGDSPMEARNIELTPLGRIGQPCAHDGAARSMLPPTLTYGRRVMTGT